MEGGERRSSASRLQQRGVEGEGAHVEAEGPRAARAHKPRAAPRAPARMEAEELAVARVVDRTLYRHAHVLPRAVEQAVALHRARGGVDAAAQRERAHAARPQRAQRGPQPRMVAIVIVHVVHDAGPPLGTDQPESIVALRVAALTRRPDCRVVDRTARRLAPPRVEQAAHRVGFVGGVLYHDPREVGLAGQRERAALELDQLQLVHERGCDKQQPARRRARRRPLRREARPHERDDRARVLGGQVALPLGTDRADGAVCGLDSPSLRDVADEALQQGGVHGRDRVFNDNAATNGHRQHEARNDEGTVVV